MASVATDIDEALLKSAYRAFGIDFDRREDLANTLHGRARLLHVQDITSGSNTRAESFLNLFDKTVLKLFMYRSQLAGFVQDNSSTLLYKLIKAGIVMEEAMLAFDPTRQTKFDKKGYSEEIRAQLGKILPTVEVNALTSSLAKMLCVIPGVGTGAVRETIAVGLIYDITDKFRIFLCPVADSGPPETEPQPMEPAKVRAVFRKHGISLSEIKRAKGIDSEFARALAQIANDPK